MEGNKGENLCDLGLGNNFLTTTLKKHSPGVPGRLSQLSVCLGLRSWSQGAGIESQRQQAPCSAGSPLLPLPRPLPHPALSPYLE